MDVRDVDEMPADIRIDYLRSLHNWQMAAGVTNGPYQEYRRYERRCAEIVDDVTRERCRRDRWETSPHCLQHSTVDEIDPNGAEERRRAAARARAAAMTEAALDELEKILLAPDTEIGPSVRMKAIESVLDRGGLPKRSESKQEVSGEVTHTVDTRQLIEDRLDRMGESMLNRELAGIEEASVVEAELTEFEEDVDDGA